MSKYIQENRGFITASKLKTYISSKEAYKKVYIDEIDTSFIKESSSLEKGTMVDQYILTPLEFNKNYAILDGNKKDDLVRQCLEKGIPVDTKDKVDDLKAKLVGNKEVLTDGEIDMLSGIKYELQRQHLFDFNGPYEAQKELIVEYKGFKLKGKIDRYSEEKGLIRDLKTTKDLEYSSFYKMTHFENNLNNRDEYQYGLQLAWYWVLAYIHTKKEFHCILDGIKTTGNYAYESYFYHSDTLKKIAFLTLFPALDQLIEDTKNNSFVDISDERGEIINNRYYPVLESAIQKDFRVVVPYFDTIN